MIKEYIVKITDDVISDGFIRFEEEYSPEMELVRCKDCKYRKASRIHDYDLCMKSNEKIKGMNWFCADGKKVDT